MDSSLKHALKSLARGELLRIENGTDKTVAVFDGTVWITQHNDRRDFVRCRGETFTIETDGLVIVQALERARVLVLEPSSPGSLAQEVEAEDRRARTRRSGGHGPYVTAIELQMMAREARGEVIAAWVRSGLARVRRLWSSAPRGVGPVQPRRAGE